MKTYFVSYFWSDSKTRKSGYGNVTFELNTLHEVAIKKMQKWLHKNAEGDAFSIINIIKLKEFSAADEMRIPDKDELLAIESLD